MGQVRQPDFLCIGGAKCATTTLHELLLAHPEICLPVKKEINYFDNDRNYKLGVRWYNDFFSSAREEKICGEVSADYLYYPLAAERIRSLLGEKVRLIVMLRQPAERAYSEYLHVVRRAAFQGSFAELIAKEQELNGSTDFENRYFLPLKRSRYGEHLKTYLSVFPREQFHFVFTEDLAADQAGVFGRICDFLSVERVESTAASVSNVAFEPKSMRLQKLVHKENRFKTIMRHLIPSFILRKKIRQLVSKFNRKDVKVAGLSAVERKELTLKYFKNDIAELQKITGRDLSAWLD